MDVLADKRFWVSFGSRPFNTKVLRNSVLNQFLKKKKTRAFSLLFKQQDHLINTIPY